MNNAERTVMKSALAFLWERADGDFFRRYPARVAHIRAAYAAEQDGEFWSLGSHERNRRRIILWRVPEGNPYYDPVKRPLLRIPFLAFADETISDTDEVLVPIIDEVMRDAAKRYGAG